ncbi:DNA polymerase IV [Bacteroidota bacterium]
MTEFHKIIHVDMDAFFASVEQRDHPELRGKPVAVGGNKIRGVVAAASYEARKFGVRSAMPSKFAYKLCPKIIFVKPRFDAYKEASDIIMSIFRSHTDLVEPVSIDEAYLDVTENKFNIPSAKWIAMEIRQKIYKQTKLTASAGVSFNKFLAKVASDYNKPDALMLITPEQADEFIDKLQIGKIPGVGKVTEEKMNNLGILTGEDLKKRTKYFLTEHFGKAGAYFYELLRHNVDNPVTPNRIRKSIGSERTFEKDISDEQQMIISLHEISKRVAERMEKRDIMGKTVTIKIKYHDFELSTRSRTVQYYIHTSTEVFDIASELLFVPVKPIKPVRLLGIQISNLNTEPAKQYAKQIAFDFYRETEVEIKGKDIDF